MLQKQDYSLTIKKTKIMTTEVRNFNIENEDINIVKYFLYHGIIISPNRNCSKEIGKKIETHKGSFEGLRKAH